MGGKKDVGIPQGPENEECGETLNKMAWAPHTLQGMEGAMAVGRGVCWEGNGVQHLRHGEDNKRMTGQPLWGQAACLCGQNDFGTRGIERDW